MEFFGILLSFYMVFGYANANELYNEGATMVHLSVDLTNDDPDCENHMHKFYRLLECQPEISPGTKCPTSYNCPSLQNRSPDLCYLGRKSYPVGFNLTRKQMDFHTPCIQSCQCVRNNESARFHCSTETSENCDTLPGCRHFQFKDLFPCCQRGVVSCPQGKPESVKCEYEGRTYSEGERFYPGEDMSCMECICAAGFNGTLSAPYCHQSSCLLWGETPATIARGCIPVYLSDKGCCPQGYVCPKPSDRVIKTGKKVSYKNKTDKTCQFGNLTLEVGDKLFWTSDEEDAKKMVCTCRVPPLASCVRKEEFY